MGAEFIGDVATAADGSAYAVGTTDSFAVDEFGPPSPRIFIVKFAPDGSVVWERIWNGSPAMASPPLPSAPRTRCSWPSYFDNGGMPSC